MASNKSTTDKSNAQAVAKQVAAEGGKKAASKADKNASSGKKGSGAKAAKPGVLARAKTYFKGVRSELKRVVWPTKSEMVKYTGAVVGMLIFFGILIALVDAVIVPVLYAFAGLR